MTQELRLLARSIALVSAFSLICFGQVERGGISGVVLDPTGASMIKVRVSATNQATGTVTRVETTADGYYKIPYNFPPTEWRTSPCWWARSPPSMSRSNRVRCNRKSPCPRTPSP
ncbi:MAG: carboxypeptidase regulatory-like domain-containing protein [Bryobacterales bacterium]|nr:carboxypeptidase regulatory-like domain-containing protein [Bryobacterales bacterium]